MLVRITYLGTLLLKKIICRRYVDAPRKKKQGRAASFAEKVLSALQYAKNISNTAQIRPAYHRKFLRFAKFHSVAP